MTKILNLPLKIKGDGREGWHMRSPPTLPPPPKKNLERALKKKHYRVVSVNLVLILSERILFMYSFKVIHFSTWHKTK